MPLIARNLGMITSQCLLKLTSVLAVCLLVQGCVGLALFGTKTSTLDPPAIKDNAKFDNVWEYGGSKNIPKLSAAMLRSNWGEPVSVEQSSTTNQVEIWTYKFDRIWCGITPCLVVPVPLVLPIGRQKVFFFVREGQVIKAEVVKSGSAGAVFFLLTAEGPCKCLVW